MNRPRPSILQLFDPLSTRDVHSPESDKENSLPDFFSHPHAKYLSPVRLTRRLVEVGDVTVELGDVGPHFYSRAKEEEDAEDEDDTIGINLPPSPRTPFGDIPFDREQTPMRSKMYRRQAVVSTNPPSVVVPDNDHAFAPIIIANNTAGATFGDLHSPPSVVVCFSDDSPARSNADTDVLSASLATLSLATPTGSLIADATMAFPTPSEASSSLPVPTARPRPPSASAMSLQHMDRLSVDLHSSFALHINSPETSFDLLNDKISFFGQDGEETFDMEGVLRSIHEEEESNENEPSPLPRSESFMHDEPSPVGTALENIGIESQEMVREGRVSCQARVASSSLLVEHAASCPSTDIAPSSQAAFIAPQSSSISPTAPVFATPVQRQLSSTSDDKPTGPPALVPALKIVKRKRPDTTTLPSTAAPTTSCKRLQSPSLLLRVPSPDPPSVTSDPIRQAPTAVGRYVTEGPGPWRVPISNNDKEKVAATARNQKPTLGSVVSGPRRVLLVTLVPDPAPVPAPKKTLPQAPAVASGVRRPSRLVAPSASVSSLPRAVGVASNTGSRLPLPRSKIAGPSAVGGTGFPRRRVA